MTYQSHSQAYTRRKSQFKKTHAPTAALFTIARTWKQPKYPSTEEWIKKIWYIYTIDFFFPEEKSIIIQMAVLDGS